jgi:hypothetical protein
MNRIYENIVNFLNPSTIVGALIIGILASLIVALLYNRKHNVNIQKAKNINGDMIQNSTINKGDKK